MHFIFFQVTREAYRRTFFVTLGTLLDQDDNSIAIPPLLRRMAKVGFDVTRLQTSLVRIEHLRKKVWKVRTKVYAHRDGRKTDIELFEEAGVRVWEIRRLTTVLLAILHRLQDALAIHRTYFSPHAGLGIKGVLAALAFEHGA